MPKCQLRIEIDGEGRVFRPGEAITGRVIAEVDEGVTPKAVVIEQLWKTHGRGNTAVGEIAEHSEPGRPWMAGMSYTHAFRFEVPPLPASYHGHLVNVDHYIAARADLPWALDPRSDADYLIEPGAGSREAYLAAAREDSTQVQQATGCVKVIGWILAPLLIAMVLALLLILLPILLVVGLVKLIRRSSAERKLGKVTWKVEADPLAANSKEGGGSGAGWLTRLKARFETMASTTYVASPGQRVPVSLRFTPPDTVSVDAIQVLLVGSESATAGSGTNSHTYRHELTKVTLELSGPRMYSGGSELRLEGMLSVPADAPFSFKASDNTVDWTLTVRVEIPQWPDWVHEDKLLIVPAS